MNRNLWPIRIIFFLLLQGLVSLSLMATEDEQFKNRVNLALRQTGHHLLLAQCDSTSTIAPVEYYGENGFLLPLKNLFDYEMLPTLLTRAFEDYDISEPYELVVKNCDTGIPFLGYNKAALDRADIPCLGREQTVFCANIFVQFRKKTTSKPKKTFALAWLLLPILTGLGFLLFKKVAAKPTQDKPNDKLQLGQYYFDPKNQTLVYKEEKFNLTFRENKLLHLFVNQPNQILNRSEILAVVWEDEGVIVGRSLDVFISRLRKLLKRDPAVQIKNIHGVGYRLELPKAN